MKRIAPLVAVIVLIIVAVVVFKYEGASSSKTNVPLSQLTPNAPGISELPGLTPGVPKPNSQQAPPIMGAEGGDNKQVAPMLGDLVGRLEEKVKADPNNVGNQILLAQTYSELGRTEDGIAILRKIPAGKPESPRVSVVLASLLSKSADPAQQVEALKLLDQASKADEKQAGFAALYKGRIYLAQGKSDVATKTWKDVLKKLPTSDGARSQIEDELAKMK